MTGHGKMSSHSEDTSTLWGWEQYFEELSTFVSSIGRSRIAYANERYTQDRLSTCVSTIGRLLDYIHSAMESARLDDDEYETIDVLQSQLSQLLDQCVRKISEEWQSHFDQLQMHSGMMNQQGGISFELLTRVLRRSCTYSVYLSLAQASMWLDIFPWPVI